MNNKQLYERIMRNISKQIKHTLNEETEKFNVSDYQNNGDEIIGSESVEQLTKEDHTEEIKEVEAIFSEISDALLNKNNYSTHSMGLCCEYLTDSIINNWETILQTDDHILAEAIKNIIKEGVIDYYHSNNLFLSGEDAYPIFKKGFDKKPEYFCFVYEKPYQSGTGLIYIGTLKFTHKFVQDLPEIIDNVGYDAPTPETYKKINTAANTFIDVFIDFPENDNHEIAFFVYGKTPKSKKYNEIGYFDLELDSLSDYENKLTDMILYNDPNCFWDDYYDFMYEEIDNNKDEE